jgi:hypothetical protein
MRSGAERSHAGGPKETDFHRVDGDPNLIRIGS